MDDTKIDIICDNGGGITLQYHGDDPYTHYYSDPAQVIEDLRAIEDGNSPEQWDGNEYDDEVMEYDHDIARNGGYRWFDGTASEILSQLADMDEGDIAWANVRNLVAARHSSYSGHVK
ncbi:MAG: hypothetical protein WC322_02255 [Candidatus Paceibacterota bacterium]|jgi:hypothetical protein